MRLLPYNMEIPINIPRHIIQDPISKSIIYYFSTKDGIIDTDGDTLFKFPYSKDTFWTNFKYVCYGNKPLKIGIKLVTTNGYSYEIAPQIVREQKSWEETVWPLPSIKMVDGGVYFKIKLVAGDEIAISLLGFMDLYPSVEHYMLLSPYNQFVFSNNVDLSVGSIYNVEHCDNICDIVKNACEVQLIKYLK